MQNTIRFEKYVLIGQCNELFLVNQKMTYRSHIMKPWVWKLKDAKHCK